MKNVMLVFVLTIVAMILASCASNKAETSTTTTTTTSAPSHQQGTGLPSQQMPAHGM
ncbi:MAG TPA: hypothetical protein VLK27_02075 [Chthoniobacterales bacterium]|nr:hypothetical protein [Chthoniobacterales bacterium]